MRSFTSLLNDNITSILHVNHNDAHPLYLTVFCSLPFSILVHCILFFLHRTSLILKRSNIVKKISCVLRSSETVLLHKSFGTVRRQRVFCQGETRPEQTSRKLFGNTNLMIQWNGWHLRNCTRNIQYLILQFQIKYNKTKLYFLVLLLCLHALTHIIFFELITQATMLKCTFTTVSPVQISRLGARALNQAAKEWVLRCWISINGLHKCFTRRAKDIAL